jgi:hypothetical protein
LKVISKWLCAKENSVKSKRQPLFVKRDAIELFGFLGLLASLSLSIHMGLYGNLTQQDMNIAKVRESLMSKAYRPSLRECLLNSHINFTSSETDFINSERDYFVFLGVGYQRERRLLDIIMLRLGINFDFTDCIIKLINDGKNFLPSPIRAVYLTTIFSIITLLLSFFSFMRIILSPKIEYGGFFIVLSIHVVIISAVGSFTSMCIGLVNQKVVINGYGDSEITWFVCSIVFLSSSVILIFRLTILTCKERYEALEYPKVDMIADDIDEGDNMEHKSEVELNQLN